MSKVHELLKNLRKNIEEDYNCFLCVNAELIGGKFLSDFVKSQKPTEELHAEFYNHISFKKERDSYAWWDSSKSSREQCNAQRKLFIDKLIKITLCQHSTTKGNTTQI